LECIFGMFIEFILIFTLSYFFIHLVKKYAPSINLIDIPNDRSTHIDHIPRGAGIGFYLGSMLILPFLHLHLMLQYSWTFLAIFLVFIVGILDDHHDTSPNTKFIILIIATALLSFNGLIINNIGSFFGMPIVLGWFALPFTMFAVTGFTNALNLVDGLDGLAATVSIVILGAFFIVGYQYDDTFIMILSMAFIASLSAFLFYNWHPASIFMGDSGSMTLGFIISVLAIKSLDYLPTVSILFVAALPIFDTLIIMTRRKLKGGSIFAADRCHLHHIVRHFFMEDTQKTVLFFGVLQASYSLTGLQLDTSMDEGYLMLLFIINTAMLYLVLSTMIKRQKRDC